MPTGIPNKKIKPPKYAIFSRTSLSLPTNPTVYKLRRVYWLITNYHRLLEKDPTAIPTKQYLDLLDTYTKLVEDAKKKGLDSKDGRRAANSRVDPGTVAKDVPQSDDETALRDSLPFGMGT